MSTPQLLSPAETHLGQALALIHRALPRLDESGRCGDVQTALRHAAAAIESARAAHEQAMGASGAGAVNGELLAIISAAVAAVLDRPYRVLEVQRRTPVVTWVNAWAIEGRFKHYSSHKVR
jgi:hypothetical protein